MDIIIKKAELTDSIHFAKLTSSFWKIEYNEILRQYNENMPLFIEGYFLAELNLNIIGSSEGYPIKSIKPISYLNTHRGPIELFDLKGKYYYIHIIQVLPKFQNMGIGGLLFRAQLELAIRSNAKYICGISLKGQLSHWSKYGFEEYGELKPYKNFGIFKWIKMKIG
jgi:GNAT superfamily N-acetyltransferase